MRIEKSSIKLCYASLSFTTTAVAHTHTKRDACERALSLGSDVCAKTPTNREQLNNSITKTQHNNWVGTPRYFS